MAEKPARRWWSFSLWQLLAVMTVIGIYFGYQINVVQSRRALIEEMTAKHYLQVTTAAEQDRINSYINQNMLGNGSSPPPVTKSSEKLSYIRRWLGDETVVTISHHQHIDAADVQRLKRAFPEANVVQTQILHEPCHPGCFPHGTLVETPFGPQKIDAIAVGDEVWVISPDGKRISLPVVSIFRTTNRLWIVETSRGELRTTETQPLCTNLDDLIEAGKLRAGDVILGWSPNETDDGLVQEVGVVSVTQTDEVVPVVNLVLGNREPFIANGYLARSKPPKDAPVEQLITSQEPKHLHEHHP